VVVFTQVVYVPAETAINRQHSLKVLFLFKIHPNLGLNAMIKRLDRPYRIWVLARSLDPQGSSYVRLSTIRDLIDHENMRGLSPATFKKLIKSGHGIFWNFFKKPDGSEWLQLIGLERVCLALEVERLRYTPVPFEYRWARSLRAFRSAIYASIFPSGDDFGRPISRRILEKITGKKARTQQRYDKYAGVEKKKNAQATGIAWKKGDTNIPAGFTVDYVRGKLELLKRMPNSYKTSFKKTARGMTRRVNRALRSESLRSGEGQTNARHKLFYGAYKSAERRIQSNNERPDFLFVKTKKESRGGTSLWNGITKMEGKVFFSCS